ncbi:MAG: inositol monophosphatase family protein [Dehalococcoidia bacterium]
MSQELAELLGIAQRAAELAGEVVMPLFRAGVAAELKSDGTPVTVADRRAEEAMRAFLAKECPAFGILGEEFGETPGDGRHRWVLDPIDGTKAFVHGVPLFGTLVALERAGVPVLGVIACHAAGETIAAAEGLGTALNGRRVRVSTTRSLGEATVLATSPSRLFARSPAGFEAFTRAKLFRTWGDCYGYLLVASGRADVMVDPEMNPWDLAALYPVIREAGGTISEWSGAPGPGADSIATNGLLHSAVVAALRPQRGAGSATGRSRQ